MSTRAPANAGRPARRAVTPAGATKSRAQSVLDAAIREFLENGYEGANVRSILAASGASAGSVYRRFGSKKGLFREIIDSQVDLSYPRGIALRKDAPSIEDELRRFARAYLREFLGTESMAIFGMLMAEAERFPEESRRLWELGPQKAVEQLADYLRHHRDRGTIDIEDPQVAAALFLDMIKGGLHVRRLLAGVVPTAREIDANVRQAVAIFSRGILSRR